MNDRESQTQKHRKTPSFALFTNDSLPCSPGSDLVEGESEAVVVSAEIIPARPSQHDPSAWQPTRLAEPVSSIILIQGESPIKHALKQTENLQQLSLDDSSP